jgi:hypothetical protein
VIGFTNVHDISTEKEKKEQNPRLPCQTRNSRRSKDAFPPPGKGKEETDCINPKESPR